MGKLLALFDLDALRLVHPDQASGWLVGIFVALTFAGSGWGLFATVPLLALPRARRFAIAVVVVTGITAGLVAALKPIVGRVRPCNALGWCRAIAVAAPTDYSFPSGHAAGTFALAGLVLGLGLDRRIGLAALGFALLVSLSRVVLGVHYPTDVLAGAVMGLCLGLLGARWYYLGQTRSSGASRQGSGASSGST